MEAWIEAHGIGDTNQMHEYAKALVDRYGESAASYACQMYDELAEVQGAKVPAAVPAQIAGQQEIARAINGSILQSETGAKVPGVVERFVKQGAEDTMLKNAKRDHAEWAWVPHGMSCAFCITLASRGWQHASKAVLKGGHALHIHPNCDCEFVVRFDKKSNVNGYNPDQYLKMYRSAEGKGAKEKLNALRRGMYQEKKDAINEQKRKNYAQSRQIKLDNEETSTKD